MRKKGMKFVLTVDMALEVRNGSAQVVVKDVRIKPPEVSLPLGAAPAKGQRPRRKKVGKSIYDIVLESARKVSRNTEGGVFSSVDLYRQASRKYPELNRKSFNTTVISAAPEHTSWKYYRNGKDYLVYLGKGKYRLRESTE